MRSCETVGRDLDLIIQLMLFLKREYVADSESSSSGSEEAPDQDYRPPVPMVTQGPKSQSKAKEQKVDIYIPEPPSERPAYQRARPGSANARPGTGNAAMRARMMEQRKPTPAVLKTYASPDQALDDLDLLLQSQFGRTFAPTAPKMPAYEPTIGRINVPLPAAVSIPKTVFKSEDIEETKLEETQIPAPKGGIAKPSKQDTPPQVSHFAFEEDSTTRPEIHKAPIPVESIWGPSSSHPVSEKSPVLTEEAKKEPPMRPATSKPPVESLLPAKAEFPKLVPQPTLVRELLQDMRKFLTSPLPKNITVLCSIRRDSRGIKKRFYPKYIMHLSEGYTFLLAGKKRANSQTSNYLISMNQDELSTRNPAYLGKLRSNFLGTQFVIYDTGLDPAKKTATPETIREELGVALYESNLLTNKGPRKMRVLLPFVNLQNERLEWKPTRKEESMGERYQAGDTAGMMTFFNKPPKWNDHIQAFVLNFNGRVDRASVKNFQLIDDQDENTVYLQFGRVGDKDFNLDFQWPFSPLQAFAIALSSFDYKIACE